MSEPRFVVAAKTTEVPDDGFKVVTVDGHSVVLISHNGSFYALDNRCPHMGFPLHRGSLTNGILTCDWHHARFDLCSGGTFDLWADDARTFPVDVRDDEIRVDVSPTIDMRPYYRRRLLDGIEHQIPLLLAKGVIALIEAGEDPAGPIWIGLDFGVRYRAHGWGQGLTQLVCFSNITRHLDVNDVPKALYHGLRAVTFDWDGPRFVVDRLPGTTAPLSTLKRWFREFVEVRDEEGAERCLVSAIRAGAETSVIADMLFAAATDHRYLSIGHVVDFTNKALESLEHVGWQHAEPILSSLVHGLATATRAEESLSWRHPIDLIHILQSAFDEIEPCLEKGRDKRGTWNGRAELLPVVIGVEPRAIADALLEAIRDGATEDDLGAAVAYAAALRIAKFPTSNEFPDWDTALHTFSFANAVHQGLRRAPSPELLRGVFDAAMSVYLDRFLNAPAVALPDPEDTTDDPESLLAGLPETLDRQQQVNPAGRTVALYLQSGGDPDRLLAMLGRLLLREDRDFHSIQTIEAAFAQYESLRGTQEGTHVLVAASRYLAAHAPTVRSHGQTYRIAQRLHRGENVYEDEETVPS